MNVILLKDVRDVGKKYEIKKVSDGFALNFLIPKNLAEVAVPASVKRVEKLRVQEDLKRKASEDALRASLKKIESQTLSVSSKVNEKGHLFKGIHKEEIANLIMEKSGVQVNPDYITLEKPIKAVGTFEIPISIGDMTVNFSLEVVEKK